MAAIAKDATLSSLEGNLLQLVPSLNLVLNNRLDVRENLLAPRNGRHRPDVVFDDAIYKCTYGTLNLDKLKASAKRLHELMLFRIERHKLPACLGILLEILPRVIECQDSEDWAIKKAKEICSELLCGDGNCLDDLEDDELRDALQDFVDKLSHLQTTFVSTGSYNKRTNVITLYLNAILSLNEGNNDFSNRDFRPVNHVGHYSSSYIDFERVACTFAYELFHYFHENSGDFPEHCWYSNEVIIETLATEFASSCYPGLKIVDPLLSVVDYPYNGCLYLPRVQEFWNSYFSVLFEFSYLEKHSVPRIGHKTSRAIALLLGGTEELFEVLNKDKNPKPRRNKVAEIMRQAILQGWNSGVLSQSDIDDLCSGYYSKIIFDLRYPVLSQHPVKNKYYSKPLFENYYFCNDWYAMNLEYVNEWKTEKGIK